MTIQLVASSSSLPSVFTARPEALTRLRDFFSSHIRNPNTRRTYMEAVRQFSAFCTEIGIVDLAQLEPVHVAAFIELQLKTGDPNSSPYIIVVPGSPELARFASILRIDLAGAFRLAAEADVSSGPAAACASGEVCALPAAYKGIFAIVTALVAVSRSELTGI